MNKVEERAKNSCCQSYSLIVMDVNMPIMDGIESTKIINEKIKKKEIPYMPIIALSAGQLRADEEKLYFEEIGFKGFVAKPTTKVEFLKAIRKFGL